MDRRLAWLIALAMVVSGAALQLTGLEILRGIGVLLLIVGGMVAGFVELSISGFRWPTSRRWNSKDRWRSERIGPETPPRDLDAERDSGEH